MYMSPWVKDLQPKKFNPKNQYSAWTNGNLLREMCFTHSGFIISVAFELFMLRWWTRHPSLFYTDFWAYPTWSVGNLLAIAYWREFHFFFAHRMMHPWWPKASKGSLRYQLDAGRLLYKYAHSYHHKSYNPGPWSGLSMHPIEHLFYFSCTLIPMIIPQHPIHFLFNKVHAEISPVAGHDGYDIPGGGSMFHYLHHAHFECNYGTPLVPLDKLFGTRMTSEEANLLKKKSQAS